MHPMPNPTQEVLDYVASLNATILPDYSPHLPWRGSRLVKLGDRDAPISLLDLLAQRKFVHWDDKTHHPIWADGNWMNESFDNVTLALRSVKQRTTKGSRYGVKAGTAEYRRLYYLDHQEQNRLYQRHRYSLKRRQELQALQVLNDLQEVAPEIRALASKAQMEVLAQPESPFAEAQYVKLMQIIDLTYHPDNLSGPAGPNRTEEELSDKKEETK